MKKLSIIVPVFNEEKTVSLMLKKLIELDLKKLGLSKEIIAVNDGSKDNSIEIIKKFRQVKLINHSINKGKGAALRTGLKHATGGFIIIQDADLEYNPKEIPKLIQPLIEGKAKVVYGSRFSGKITGHKIALHDFGNKFLSFATSILFGQYVSDMETCYKAMEARLFKSLNLVSDSFEIEPEITSKLLRKKIKILELPISFNARSFEEGKKINWVDGLKALKTLLKYRFARI